MKSALGLIACLALLGCTSSRPSAPARIETPSPPPPSMIPTAPIAPAGSAATEASTEAAGDVLWIGKPDGSKQCEAGGGIPLEQGAEGLKRAGVSALEARKGDDGMMHVAMCGAATGKENQYRIRRAELARAQGLGYHPLGKKAGK